MTAFTSQSSSMHCEWQCECRSNCNRRHKIFHLFLFSLISFFLFFCFGHREWRTVDILPAFFWWGNYLFIWRGTFASHTFFFTNFVIQGHIVNETEQNWAVHHFRTSKYHIKRRRTGLCIAQAHSYEIRSNWFYVLGPFGPDLIKLFFLNFEGIRHLRHSIDLIYNVSQPFLKACNILTTLWSSFVLPSGAAAEYHHQKSKEEYFSVTTWKCCTLKQETWQVITTSPAWLQLRRYSLCPCCPLGASSWLWRN